MTKLLTKEFVTVLTGNAAVAGAGFVVSILVARSMPVADFGLFATMNIILGMLPMLLDFGSSTAIVRHLVNNREDEADIISSNALFKMLSGALLSIPLLLFSPILITYIFTDSSQSALLNYIWFGALFLQIAYLFQAVAQTEAKLANYTAFNLLQAAGRLILIAVLVYSGTATLRNLIMAISASCILPFVWGIYLYAGKLKPRINWSLLSRQYSFAKWVGISSLLAVLLMRVDIFMLNRLAPREQVGYYSVAFQLAFIFPIVTMSLTNSLLPKVSALVNRKDQREYIRKIIQFTPWIIAAWLLITLTADRLIPLLFSDRYLYAAAPFKPLLAVFMMGMIITPLGMLAYPINRPELHVKLYSMQIFVNVAADYLLIPAHGAFGAAMGTAAAKLFGAVFIVYWLWKNIYRSGAEAALKHS